MFCVFLVIWGFWNHFKFEKESRAFRETKSQPAVGAREGLLVGKEPETPPAESAAKDSASV